MKSWAVHKQTYYMLGTITCAALPLIGALGVFGWRTAVVLMLVWLGALGCAVLLRFLRSAPLRTHHSLIFLYAAIVALFLPAQWSDVELKALGPGAQWPIALVSGVILTLSTWAIERIGTARVHPLVASILLIHAAFFASMKPDRVLERSHAFLGDLMDTRVGSIPSASTPWLNNRDYADSRVIEREAPASIITRYLTSTPRPDEATNLVQLIADQLPPLEDVMIGGTPNTLGSASAIFVAVGGLFLVSRRRLYLRWPLVAVLVMYAVVLIAPIPIERTAGKSLYRWCIGLDTRVSWAMAVTFANYLLCAGPMLLTTFFVMAMPGVRPIGPRAAMAFAILYGILTALCSLYINVALGPIIAIGLTNLFSLNLDQRLIRRPSI